MAYIHLMRGMLLEEAILALLRIAGYDTIVAIGTDPTLVRMGGGLGVKGRGADHQIDAIADLRLGHAFSNPQRLLVEGKFYADRRTVGIDIIRNTIGVVKDVGEFWTREDGAPGSRRYHYQAAIFSASRFSQDAQDYAFAHDVYLLPLARSAFFRPVLATIDSVATALNANPALPQLSLSELRAAARNALQGGGGDANFIPGPFELAPLVEAVRTLRHCLIGTIGRSFPVFLTPSEPRILDTLRPIMRTRIHFNNDGWYLYSGGRRIFSFDLPEELVDRYAERGELTPRRAIDLKTDFLDTIDAVYMRNNAIHVTRFQMDREWLAEVRQRVRDSKQEIPGG